jgi:hypothetical protein
MSCRQLLRHHHHDNFLFVREILSCRHHSHHALHRRLLLPQHHRQNRVLPFLLLHAGVHRANHMPSGVLLPHHSGVCIMQIRCLLSNRLHCERIMRCGQLLFHNQQPSGV